MIPGIFVNGSSAVLTGAGGAAGMTTRRGHGARRRPSAEPFPAGICGRVMRLPTRATGRAVTVHLPGLMPRTSAVSATGPLPGTIPS